MMDLVLAEQIVMNGENTVENESKNKVENNTIEREEESYTSYTYDKENEKTESETESDNSDFLVIDRKNKMYVLQKDGVPLLSSNEKKKIDKKIDQIMSETIMEYLDYCVYMNSEIDEEDEKLYVITILPKNEVWKTEREIHTISVFHIDCI